MLKVICIITYLPRKPLEDAQDVLPSALLPIPFSKKAGRWQCVIHVSFILLIFTTLCFQIDVISARLSRIWPQPLCQIFSR